MAAGSSAPAATPAVSLSDVQVSFRLADDTTYTAVQRATLDVADGEFVAIVGPTGCGKSTLLNVAAGLIAPSNGTATIFGSALNGLNRPAGYLFQAEALFPWKTAIENVAIGLEIAGTPKAEARERAQSWLARVGIVLPILVLQVVVCDWRWGRSWAGVYAVSLPVSALYLWRYAWLLMHRSRLLGWRSFNPRVRARLEQKRRKWLRELDLVRDAYTERLGVAH